LIQKVSSNYLESQKGSLTSDVISETKKLHKLQVVEQATYNPSNISYLSAKVPELAPRLNNYAQRSILTSYKDHVIHLIEKGVNRNEGDDDSSDDDSSEDENQHKSITDSIQLYTGDCASSIISIFSNSIQLYASPMILSFIFSYNF